MTLAIDGDEDGMIGIELRFALTPQLQTDDLVPCTGQCLVVHRPDHDAAAATEQHGVSQCMTVLRHLRQHNAFEHVACRYRQIHLESSVSRQVLISSLGIARQF